MVLRHILLEPILCQIKSRWIMLANKLNILHQFWEIDSGEVKSLPILTEEKMTQKSTKISNGHYQVASGVSLAIGLPLISLKE